jgi:hypothetical protein
MKAFIYFDSEIEEVDYNGEGVYILVTEDDKCIGNHYCSSRGFANHDLTEWRLKELKENNISEVYSNGKLVWKDNEPTADAIIDFREANEEYESKFCRH